MRPLALCLALALVESHAVGAPAESQKAAATSTSKTRTAPKKRSTKASKAKPATPKAPPTKLPGPIEIARVHVEVAEDGVLVTSEVALGKGEWDGGDLRAHAAYGAPGIPLAFQAHLCAPREGGDEPECRALPHEFSRTAPSDAAFVIGPAKMAGETIEIDEKGLTAIFAQHPRAILRLRQLRSMPIADGTWHREILVRLGASRGRPHRLGSIEIEGRGLVVNSADARLCGLDVRPTEISVVRGGVASKGVPPRLLDRAGNEDLCVRFRF